MKTVASVVVLCLALACTTLTEGARLDRTLKLANNPSPASVSVSASATTTAINGVASAIATVDAQAINDQAVSIASAVTTAIGEAEGDGDVDATSDAFAQAIAEAYAKIISIHYGSVSANGQFGTSACAFTSADGFASANAFSRAFTAAFASSTNEVAQALGDCYSQAMTSASVEAVQNVDVDICASNGGSASVYARFVTIGFVKAISTSFSHVFTAIQDGTPNASATCLALSNSLSGVVHQATFFTSFRG